MSQIRSPFGWGTRSMCAGLAARGGSLYLLFSLISPMASAMTMTDIRPASPFNQEGQDASASAISTDPSNSAQAVGGDVGSATTPGLRGGDATAVADTTTSGPAQAIADSRGGSALFGASGVGGDGSATARVTSTTPALVQASAVAFGGTGSFDSLGAPGGPGGNATVDVFGHLSGDGGAIELGVLRIPVDRFVTQQPGAFGGWSTRTAAGIAGNAQSRSVAIADGDSRVVVLDRAHGGISSDGGTGGNASSYAEGSNAGQSTVRVEANATSGFGRAASGTVSARARGVSTGGGDVFVTAVQAGSLDTATSGIARSAMRDAVTGGTSGHLYLEQQTIGATTNRAGGDATAALSATNELGGDLDAKVVATGGNVDLQGPGDAGDATIERLDFTGSAGRAVRLTGAATGGSLDQLLGRAGDASITSRILNSLAATVALDLQATGGNAFNENGNGSGGQGGNAQIDSVVQTRSQRLDAVLNAKAGGGSLNPSTGQSGRGGDANLHASAINDAGSASIIGQAMAGNAGNANVDIDVTTHGDGSNISIGLVPSFPPSASGARAGSVSTSSASPSPGVPATRAGSASSRSIGQADGNAAVTIYDLAQGGSGSGDAAAGGDASSTARGISGGGKVIVQADAVAGGSGRGVDGTSASLEAYGQSTSGDVQVTGRAVSGRGRIGADTILIDRVGGATSGNLSLEQTAFAGDSDTFAPGIRSGGIASSQLHHDGSSTSATFKASAFGGLGTEGGSSDAEIVARNLGGRVTASIQTFGGSASDGFGGAAHGRIDVEAAGSVQIGSENYGIDLIDGPFAVNGGDGGFDPLIANRGGGAADSSSSARTSTGSVRIFDAAQGGDARSGFFGGPLPIGPVGDGGAARSMASAESHGVGDAVLARSIAQGGVGGQFFSDQANRSAFGTGGTAVAESHATGLGLARAEANARAGFFGTPLATAQAFANGSSSEAFATSQSQSTILRRVSITAGGHVDGIDAVARSRSIADGVTAPSWPDTNLAVLPPAHATAQSVVAGSDVLAGADDPSTPQVARALSTFNLDVGGAAGSFSSHIEIDLPRSSQLTIRNLQIQLISAHGEGALDAFHLSAKQGSISFLDQGQSTIDAATGQFDGRTYDLAGFVQTPSFSSTFVPIVIDLNWQSTDPGFHFLGTLSLTTIVPEPGSALLIGLGLMAMATRRPRGRAARRHG